MPVGKDRKSRLEEGYHEAGYRSGWQVLSNSFTAFIAAFMWNAAFAPSSLHASLGKLFGIDVGRAVFHLNEVNIYDGTWCPLSSTVANGWSRILIFTALGLANVSYIMAIAQRSTLAMTDTFHVVSEILWLLSWASCRVLCRG